MLGFHSEQKETKGIGWKWAGRIVGSIYIAALLIYFFIHELYLEKKEFESGRIVQVVAVAVVFLIVLWFGRTIKDGIKKLGKKIKGDRFPRITGNMCITFVEMMFFCACVPILYALLETSQKFDFLRLNSFDLRYNLFIYATLLFVFLGISGKMKFSIIATSLVVLVFGMGNYFLIKFRGTALIGPDLVNMQTAMNVADGYDYTVNFYIFFFIEMISLLILIALQMKKRKYIGIKKHVVLILLGVMFAGLTSQKIVFAEGKYQRWKIKMYKAQRTYETHGCALIFAHSFRHLVVEKPEGYTVESVEKFMDGYQGTQVTTKVKPNIIMIMSEAYADLEQAVDMELSEDCMPFFHSLQDNCVKGKMFVSVLGGGTSNTEFEALTSSSLAFTPQQSSPYQTYINDDIPSLARTLKAQGYGGMIAMHPYKANGYRRNEVYPYMGFETFLTQEDFKNPKYVRNRISDEEDFERIISEYEKFKKDSDAPFFLFNVTMQNHSSYDSVWDDVPLDIKVKNYKSKTTENYLNLIKKSDEALETLITYFQKKKEPTVVVFFGDHQPRLGQSFYSKLKADETFQGEYEKLTNYFTPFMFWANYDIEEQKDIWTSGNYLASMLMDTTGLAKSGYQQFVSEVRKEVPVITHRGYIGADKKFYELEDKTSPYYDVLEQYHRVQYNYLFDTDHRYEKFFQVNQSN